MVLFIQAATCSDRGAGNDGAGGDGAGGDGGGADGRGADGGGADGGGADGSGGDGGGGDGLLAAFVQKIRLHDPRIQMRRTWPRPLLEQAGKIDKIYNMYISSRLSIQNQFSIYTYIRKMGLNTIRIHLLGKSTGNICNTIHVLIRSPPTKKTHRWMKKGRFT